MIIKTHTDTIKVTKAPTTLNGVNFNFNSPAPKIAGGEKFKGRMGSLLESIFEITLLTVSVSSLNL